jgi:dolichol-phosphate mannosyltransferase
MRALIVLPTYDEALNIEDVLSRIRASVPGAHVLVVDDGSPDGTADLADKQRELLGGIDVLRRTEKNGLGAAYCAGFAWGIERGYETIVEMDADLSHDPAVLPALLDRIEQGADLVIGSRWVAGGSVVDWPRNRELISRAGNWYARIMLGFPLRDATAGFRAYRVSLLRTIDLTGVRSSGYAFQVEMAYRFHHLGAVMAEVPITFRERARGASKMSWKIVGEALTLVTIWGLRDRLRQGLRLLGSLGRRGRRGRTRRRTPG